MGNSLISAIFRKLPLKWLLVILAVGGVLFASFSSADNIATLLENVEIPSTSISSSWTTLVDFGTNGDTYTVCFQYDDFGDNNLQTGIGSSYNSQPGTNFTYWSDWNGNYVCFYKSSVDRYLNVKSNSSSTTIDGSYFILNDLLATTIPVYTSLQCQTVYNLIPIESVDQEYCTTNNLCPSGGSPSDCPNVGISNVFINDIFHPGAFNIVINIPEEIDWDYAYTSSGSNLNIDVVGYNQDTEYINGLIDINNYQPTSEDFTNTFLLFKDYGGLLLACLFVILVFYFIKKAFK